MNATDMIEVTLSAQQWQVIMSLLAKQPYEVCAQFIHAIQSQCMNHEVAGVQGAQQRVPN